MGEPRRPGELGLHQRQRRHSGQGRLRSSFSSLASTERSVPAPTQIAVVPFGWHHVQEESRDVDPEAVAITSGVALALVFNFGAAAARPDRTVPTTPTYFRITASTSTSVSLAWNASTDKSGPFWYCVQNGGAGCIRVDPPQTDLHPLPAPAQSHVHVLGLRGLRGRQVGQPLREQQFRDLHDAGRHDGAKPGTDDLDSRPSFPTRISVAWTASVDNVSQVWYTLFVDGNPGSGHDLIGYRAATVFYLEPSSTHEFKVTARDASGNVAESNVLSVTTPATTDATPPHRAIEFASLVGEHGSRGMARLGPVHRQRGSPGADPVRGLPERRAKRRWRRRVRLEITYCRAPGPTEIVLRAVDTSGNRSGPSNAIAFAC